MYMVQFVVDQ